MYLQQAPVITLLSDLGNKHTAIGIAKAQLMANMPRASVVDITHGIDKYNIRQAAYMARSANGYFPAGSFHLLIVDISLGERHRMLLAKVGDQYFLASDNGVLSLAFGPVLPDVWLCREFSATVSVLQWVQLAADVIQLLGDTPNPDAHFARFITKDVAFHTVQRPDSGRRDCSILYTDRYGNLVLDLTTAEFHELIGDGPFEIKLPAGKRVSKLSSSYNDVAAGELLCRFNKAGLLELSINRNSLSATYDFNASYNAYNTIAIYF